MFEKNENKQKRGRSWPTSKLYFQIDRPLDRAVWWIEYAIRHPGLGHFRSPVHDLAWHEYLMLDIVVFVVAVVVLLVGIVVTFCKCLLRRCLLPKQKKE